MEPTRPAVLDEITDIVALKGGARSKIMWPSDLVPILDYIAALEARSPVARVGVLEEAAKVAETADTLVWDDDLGRDLAEIRKAHGKMIAANIRALLPPAPTGGENTGAEYRPVIIHFDGEGDPYWEFVERDTLTVTGMVFAANVEQLSDADGKLIGFRIYDPARPRSPAVSSQDVVGADDELLIGMITPSTLMHHREIGDFHLFCERLRGQFRAALSRPESGWVLVPKDDDTREFANSVLPLAMIHAGEDALDRVAEDNRNYVAVAVYRAMLAALPTPTIPQGEA